jgi:hypothetical protein
MNYIIYQLILTSEQREEMNSENSELFNDYSRNIISPTAKSIMKLRKWYKMVAVIKADSPEEVFQISNLGNQEDKITRLDRMRSVSVGDVLVDEFGNAEFVDTFGFKTIKFNS